MPWLTVAIVLLLVARQDAVGAPVWGERFELRQPDGSMVEVRIWGDEHYQVVESLDGYTLVRDPETQTICYAKLSADGAELVATDARVGADGSRFGLTPHLRIDSASVAKQVATSRALYGAPERSAPTPNDPPLPAPSTGAVRGICLIVQFPDEAGTIPSAEVDNYCNLPGYSGFGNNGSVRDYFHDVSGGALTYTNYVPPVYYTAAWNKDYYDDPAVAYGVRARELVHEALQWLDGRGFDFSQYDADGDRRIDAINCLYAGATTAGWGNGLWPHSATLNFISDGVFAYRYQITPMQNALRLGTFCHENGHMLCLWPDLYDYGGESRGAGRYCIMSTSGGTNPVQPCAYLKVLAGWAAPTVLDAARTSLPLVADSNEFYKFPHPTAANEYFLLANRQRAGRDVTLPDAGLALWHIDTLGDNDNEQMTSALHYEVTLVQADGSWELESDFNGGDILDLFDADSFAECSPRTVPNTNWWSGRRSGLRIYDISAFGAAMTFSFELDRLARARRSWLLLE